MGCVVHGRELTLPRSLIAIAAAVALVAAACSSADTGYALGARDEVCADILSATAEAPGGADPLSEQSQFLLDILQDRVPGGIEAEIGVLRDGDAADSEVESALYDIGVWLTRCGGPTGNGGVTDRRMALSTLPDDTRLCLAADVGQLIAAAAEDSQFEAPIVTIWGDETLRDPWSGPTAAVFAYERDTIPVHENSVPTSIGEHQGRVGPMPLFQAVSTDEWGHMATWSPSPGRIVEVALKGGTAQDAVLVASSATEDRNTVRLASDSLGARTVTLYEGTVPAPTAVDQLSLWQLLLQVGTQEIPPVPGSGVVTIRGMPVEDGYLDALAFMARSITDVTINGHAGIEYAMFSKADGPWGIAWVDDGLFIQVASIGPPISVLRQIAASVVEVDAAAWSQTKLAVDDCFSFQGQ